MKRINIKAFTITILTALLFSALCCVTFTNKTYAEEFTAPQNGIPLMTIYVDESDEGIAGASKADPDHEYGNIDAMNESEFHTVRCVGNVSIQVPEGFTGDYGSGVVPEGNIELQYMRGRGNSTWETDKKPYRLEFKEAQDFFGMGKSKTWALLANAYDETLVRNRVAMYLADRSGLDYTPQMIPVDVVIVGSESGSRYLGSYYLSETVKVEESRLDIPKSGKKTESEDPADDPNITGGYLLSVYSPLQDEDEPESTVFKTTAGLMLINSTPDFESEDLTAGQAKQRNYIRSFVQETEDLIMHEGDINEAVHAAIAEKMDMKSAADYWWLQEFSYNTDAFKTSSTHLYKTADTPEEQGKLFWGPSWDFDLAWSVGSSSETGSATGFNKTEMIWLDKLRRSDPAFTELLKERWNDPDDGINKTLAEITAPGGMLDIYKEELRASREADLEVRRETEEGEYRELSYDEIIEKLRKWIEVRRAWINENLDKLSVVYHAVTYEAEGEVFDTVTVRGNTELGSNIMGPAIPGKVFTGWKEKISGADHVGYRVSEDTTFTAVYIDESEAVLPEKIYFPTDSAWASTDLKYYYFHKYKTEPDTEYEGVISWSSSDENVAYVDKTGLPKIVGPGETTITATLGNGYSASYVLHVYNPATAIQTEPAGIRLDTESITIEQGETDQIRYTLLPDDRPLMMADAEFESSDETVAVADDYGVVKGLAPGETVLKMTVSTFLSDEHLVTAEIRVNVTAGENGQEESGSQDIPDEEGDGADTGDEGSDPQDSQGNQNTDPDAGEDASGEDSRDTETENDISGEGSKDVDPKKDVSYKEQVDDAPHARSAAAGNKGYMVKVPVKRNTGNSVTTVASSVKTGDDPTNLPVIIAIAASATCLISVLVVRRKKENYQNRFKYKR